MLSVICLMWQSQRRTEERSRRRRGVLLQGISWACIEQVHDCHRQMGRYRDEGFLAAHDVWAAFC